MTLPKTTHGSISLLILVFGVVFSVTIGGVVLLAAVQFTSSVRTESYEKALSVAQAGAEYYRWHLAHNLTDYTDGTGMPGPYVHTLADPYGNTDGVFELTITPPASGSSIVTIQSRGWMNNNPDIKRTVVAKYGIPSIAKFAFLHNANLWFGDKITIHGKVFSNGGIRMNGTHDSTVQSAKETYTCGSESGCDPAETRPGIWGDGGPQELWEYPVTPTDFNSFTLDLASIKSHAQTSGTYLEPSGAQGYHITFLTDGSYTIWRVNSATARRGWSIEDSCENLNQSINGKTLIGTFTIAQKPIIFVEDHLWIDGIVHGKATVAAARFPLDLHTINIWINDNLTYLAKDGNSAIGVIAQNNVIIPLNVPQILEMNGAFFAQKGNIKRHNYRYSGCGNYPQAVRQQLNVYGSLISNLKSYWNYGGGSAGFGSDPISGFSHREITYDPNLYFNPPPFFPTQGEYEFISWEEQ